MDYRQLGDFRNIAIRINDLPFHEGYLQSDKIELALFSEGYDHGWAKLPNENLVDVEELFYSDFNFDSYRQALSKINNLIDIQRQLFNQYNLYHILDRNLFFNTKSLPEQDMLINQFIIKSVCLLTEHNIDLMVIHDTPHSPHNYILFECAKALSIPILNIRQSAIPWGATIELGLGRDAYPLELSLNKHPNGLAESVGNYIKSLGGTYSDAIPEYEKERYVKYDGNLWSWKKEIRRLIKNRFSINYMRNSTSKYKTLRLLNSKSTEVSPFDRYVVFFLHYQPERTTLPEGDIFNQQLLAIQSLRSILPEDVKLVVREHPSTYRNKFIKKFRPNSFYNEISMMKGVVLSSPLQNPFDLLDGALFISTITGTVGIEAVIRGKCCIYFGNAVYKKMPGAYHIDEVWQDRELLEQIVSDEVKPNISQVESYFEYLLSYSVNMHSYKGSFADYNAHLKNASEALLVIL
tara:strand:- start:12229 stop:13620 length:1392 start_codon:yes stop_codon:yes gene_type:complete